MRIPSDNDSQLQQSCLGIQKESIGSPSPLQKRPMANEPIGEAPSMEHKRSQIAARPEEGGLPSSQRQTGSRGFWSRWGFRIKLMVALLLPILIETLDYTVVASAQPQIASSFHHLDLQSWIGTSYILTSTAFLPVFANVANVFGRHACLQVGLVIFLIGSALSTGSQNIAMMLAGRGIAGVGAAALLTVTRVILADSRTLDSNVWQTTMMSLLFSIGYSIGPVVGAALSTVSYRWIFAINLPISIVSGVLAFLLVRKELLGPQPDPRDQLPDRAPSNRPAIIQRLFKVDWIGACIFVTAFILVLLGMSWGSTERWHQTKVIVTIVVGGVLLMIFIGWEYYLGQFEMIYDVDGSTRQSISPKRAPRLISHTNRMIPLYIFKYFDVTVTSFGCVTGGMLMFGCLYFLSIYWTVAAGFQGTKSGTQLLYLSPGLGGGIYASLLLIKYTRQTKWPIILGQIIQPVAIGLLGRAVGNNAHGQINGFLAFVGAGIGLTIASLEIQSRFAIPNQHAAVSVTMNLFFRTAGGTIGLAQLAAVLESKLRSYINNVIRSGAVSPSDGLAILNSLSSLGRGSGNNGIETLPPNLQAIVRAAYGYGTKWAFYSLLPWCGLAAIPCFFLNRIPEVVPDGETKEEDADAARETQKPEDDDINGANNTSDNGVPRGPRIPLWVPFSLLLYGIELLLGTRRRRISR